MGLKTLVASNGFLRCAKVVDGAKFMCKEGFGKMGSKGGQTCKEPCTIDGNQMSVGVSQK